MQALGGGEGLQLHVSNAGTWPTLHQFTMQHRHTQPACTSYNTACTSYNTTSVHQLQHSMHQLQHHQHAPVTSASACTSYISISMHQLQHSEAIHTSSLKSTTFCVHPCSLSHLELKFLCSGTFHARQEPPPPNPP